MRAVTSRDIGIESPEREAVAETGRDGRILVVDDRAASAERIAGCCPPSIRSTSRPIPSEALFHAAEGNYDLLIVSLGLENFDGLRLCSQVRSLDRTRNVPILAIADAEDNARLVRGLEIGVNDYLSAADRQERAAGARAHADPQEALHRAAARQRAAVDRDGDHRRADRPLQSPLHGKPSRHAGRAGGGARQAAHACWSSTSTISSRSTTRYGHDAGDDVLREFAVRIKKSIRGIDLACRYGGEEFVVRDAGDRHGGRHHGGGAAAPADRRASRSRSSRAPAAIEVTISIGHCGAWRASDTAADASSSAPTRRSTAPSATAATGWCRTPPDALSGSHDGQP